MEDGYEHAIGHRDDCLAAIPEAGSFEDARLLWRRAKGYNLFARAALEDRGTATGDLFAAAPLPRVGEAVGPRVGW